MRFSQNRLLTCHKTPQIRAKSNIVKNFVRDPLHVLRGDFVKDDSGSYAVFTEQGSCASHMTAAKVLEDAQDKQVMQHRLTRK